ncbi:MAG: toll/interleukin-1 receptor domain-containing protein, partial [Thermoanaerobaculia bacterium]
MSGPTVFISYAREDDAHRAELRKHLRPWDDDGRLRIWDDRAIDAGTEWEPELLRALEDATIVVFLVSADLLASDFVRDVELPRALERRERGEAIIIPVIVRACSWRATALGKLQALRGGDPVPKADPDAAWAEIAEGIAAAVAGQVAEGPERQESVAELLVPEAANPDPPKPVQRKPIRKQTGDLEELFRWIETPIDGRVPLWREVPAETGWIGSPDGEGDA